MNALNRVLGRPLSIVALGVFWAVGALPARGGIGAEIPWTTIEAEAMRISGTVLGPEYAPHRLETESSGQKCVQLSHAGEQVEFDAPAAFDSLVIRFNLPDAATGGGTTSTLDLLINGKPVQKLRLSSRNAWLYGDYPFSNDPKQGKPRNFYDELRVKDLKIAKGDVVRLQKASDDGIACVIDLVDLELVPAPVARPAGSLSVLDFGASGNGEGDDTTALRACIAEARRQGRIVWVPAGDYKITGDIPVPSAVTIQGAGMWHTTFVGDAALYGQPDRRVRFKLAGTGASLADFAIMGRLNYRNDDEANDGVVVAGAKDASVARLWVEHTKTGVWVYNGSNLVVDGCRFRNLLADGVNFCVGTNHSVVQNCTARGTGDDCYAIWPVAADQGYEEQAARPGDNVIRHSTGQLPFLANGGALYGGANNRIEDCLFTDITAGCGILISTTFPTADAQRKIDNNFSGTTVVQNCRLVRCGGYDHAWAWRAAIQICLDRRSIAGLRVRRLEIRDSISDGISVVAPGRAKGEGTLSDTVLEEVTVTGVGLGAPGRHGLWIREDAAGDLTLIRAQLAGVHNESANFKINPQPERSKNP
mgnify:CR=1 FL=1